MAITKREDVNPSAAKIGAVINKSNRGRLAEMKVHAQAIMDHADAMIPEQNQDAIEPGYKEELGMKTTADLEWLNVTIPTGAMKATDEEWVADVLLIPFGGPYNGKDVTGQFFSKKTITQQDIYSNIPVYYYHTFDANGKPQSEPIVCGMAKPDHTDEKGIWYKATLDKTKDLAKKIWEAIKSGVARASSGSIQHAFRYNEDGEITYWPVVEATLTDGSQGKFQAANAYAVALPAAKVAFEKAGLTLVIPPVEGDNVSAQIPTTELAEAAKTAQVDGGNAANQLPNKELEMADITVSEEKLQQLLDGQNEMKATIDAMKMAAPAPNTVGTVAVVLDEADRPFTSLAEQAKAVKNATVASKNGSRFTADPRLNRLEHAAIKAAQGANESIPADAGYLLEPTIGAELIKPLHQEGPFSTLVSKLPVSANSNFGFLNGVDETSRKTGSRWGGVQGYRMAEAGSISGSRPKFRRINWELKKYAVLMYATDELLLDTAQFNEVAKQSAGEELAFMVNDDILNGLGVGGPLGVMQSGALIKAQRDAASTVAHADILAMWRRLHPNFRKNAKWFISPGVEPQLNALYFTGATSVLSPYVAYTPEGVLRIMGKDVVVTEFNPDLNSAGDILLGDFSQYLFWEKGDVQAATSIHIAFLTDEMAFRFIYRADGQTAHYSAITPYQGSTTQSAFVSLGAGSA